MRNAQLADILRPQTIDDIVGQSHLFGERGVIRRMLAGGRITNMIFFGPPGTGKTTAAGVIAKQSDMEFYRVNATNASLSDVKDILQSSGNLFGSKGILLYIDEIQYFNRKQQQALLEYIEDGRVTLIASTTENPHFYIYNAIISRSSLFEFKPVEPQDCAKMIYRALEHLNAENGTQKNVSEKTARYIAGAARGDVRRSIGLFENAYFAAEDEILPEHADQFNYGVANYNDDVHYDMLGCLQKSIRGSDPDAAAFYVAKMIEQGDIISLCRRLQVIATEDVGLAYPMAPAIVKACCDSARELGLPEARIPLGHAAILLATAPKSNTQHLAVDAALEDIKAGKGKTVPQHLQSPLFKGYKYPHDYPNRYVEQQYLPDDLKNRKYYVYGNNKNEKAAEEYWKKIKGK
ncbi:MAG: replication-associated recombination protein A [Ruminococcaceae bacterium]|nr:replication-associated recombination protein A [Oscillospiraceae bacterium]